MSDGKSRSADRLAEARRAFSSAAGELEALVSGLLNAAPTEGADRSAGAERGAALEDRIAELEAERERLTEELETLRAARETDAEMIEDALMELRAVV